MLAKYDDAGRMQQRSLADILALMEEKYQEQKNTKYEGLFAKLFSQWIDKAHFYGVIKEGNGLIQKLSECNTQKEELQKLVDQLAERNLELEFRNKDLEARLDQIDKMQDPFRRQNQ